MRLVRTGLTALALTLALAGVAAAGEGASKQDAVAMVKEAVNAIAWDGPNAAYEEITEPGGRFHKDDLYVMVYRINGRVLAHGAKPEWVGHNQIALEDEDGKAFIAERMSLARDRRSFWHSYKFLDPATEEVEPKETYCEVLGTDVVVCSGVYKR